MLLAYIGITFIAGEHDLALLAGCLVGACVGFLWFNAFPATIFMGDTGSLGLGGAIAGLAVMTKTEVLLILLGGIFVIEALSVVIQVFSFQTFRRRVFLMAPIHHHFELKAWSETKIILRFWIVAAICSRDRLHDLPPEPRRLSAGARPRASPAAAARWSIAARAYGCVSTQTQRAGGHDATRSGVLRVVVGGLFMGHGLQKLAGWFGGHGLEATGAASSRWASARARRTRPRPAPPRRPAAR